MAEQVIVELGSPAGIKRRKGWRKCTFNTGDILEVPEELVLRKGLSVGASLSEKDYDSLKSECEITRGKEQALRLLAYRARSEQELKQRMRKSGLRRNSAEAVIDGLKRLNLVDDEEFARKFVYDLIRRKPAGEFLIKSELQKKGISESVIVRVIKQAFDEVSPVELARKGMQQWLIRHPQSHRAGEVEQRQRIAQFLYKRGFSWSIIDEVVGDSSAFA